MTLSHRLLLAALAPLSIALSACGGGGGDFLAGGGVTGTGITSGSITGFGSVIANERVHETTADTQFVRNGDDTAIQDDFRVGDVVAIEWESDDGGVTRNATRVSYQRELFGEVTDAPNEVAGTVEVLGQVVRADATTVFDDFPNSPLPGDIFPEGLVTENCLEVTGFRDSNGDLFATRIEFEGVTCADPVELRGVIDSIGSGNTIVVSGTTVNISGAVITPAGTTLEERQLVEVVGSFGTGNILNADTVEVRDDDLSGLEDDDGDVEGIIDNCSTGCGTDRNVTFTVSGIPVTTDSGTVYEGGDFTSLANDIRVEVEGRFSAGVLVADEIKFEREANVKMETVVSSADGTTGDVTVSYGSETLTVLTDPAVTQFKDSTDTFPSFGADDLSAGDYVKIVATENGTGIIATKLELEEIASSDPDRVLEGRVTDLASRPSFIEVLGLSISTDDLSSCEDETGATVDCGDLVDSLTLNDIVQVQGEEDGALVWDELELQD